MKGRKRRGKMDRWQEVESKRARLDGKRGGERGEEGERKEGKIDGYRNRE